MGELSGAGMPTSLWKAPFQFPTIYNYIRALLHKRDSGWALPFARVNEPRLGAITRKT